MVLILRDKILRKKNFLRNFWKKKLLLDRPSCVVVYRHPHPLVPPHPRTHLIMAKSKATDGAKSKQKSSKSDKVAPAVVKKEKPAKSTPVHSKDTIVSDQHPKSHII